MPTVTDATDVRLSTVSPSIRSTAPTKITLFVDTAGNTYKQTYVPVPPASANRLRLMAERGEIQLEHQALPEEDFRAAEMLFLEENHDQLAREHAGLWIAIDGSELVASAADLATLLTLSAQAGHPDPFITAIPGEPITSLYV